MQYFNKLSLYFCFVICTTVMVHGTEHLFRVIEFSGRYDFVYLVSYLIFYSLPLIFSLVCLKYTEIYSKPTLQRSFNQILLSV
jgi:hypothetical protein